MDLGVKCILFFVFVRGMPSSREREVASKRERGDEIGKGATLVENSNCLKEFEAPPLIVPFSALSICMRKN